MPADPGLPVVADAGRTETAAQDARRLLKEQAKNLRERASDDYLPGSLAWKAEHADADALDAAALRLERAEQEQREALAPFAHFARMLAEKPLGRAVLPADHIIYGIHGGTQWEANITVGDLRRALAASPAPTAEPDHG